MVRDTVEHLRAEGQRVFVDCEHFFDGYVANRAYALEVVRTAAEAGADVVVLCDTNGGMLPHQVEEVVADTLSVGARLGIHAHNDTGCAVANSMAAVRAGATHLQGCLNGYGERTGNADLVTSVANLELKLGMQVLPEGALAEATREQIEHEEPELLDAIACTSGCAWCCIFLEGDGGLISEAEAVALHTALSPFAGTADGRDWHPEACAALDPATRLCRAYDARPMICRTFVSTDAGACRENAEGGDADYAYVKLGYKARFLNVGGTNFSIDYYQGNDFLTAGDESGSTAFTVLQEFDNQDLEVFASLRRSSYEDTSAVSYQDVDSILIGGRLKF